MASDGPTSRSPAGRRRRGRRSGSEAIRWVLAAVLIVALTVGIRLFVFESFWIPSESMEPTLHGCQGCHDDRILVFRLAYHLHDVHRGDIVVFRRPPGVPEDEKYLVKRVIALPGQTVLASKGVVRVNGRPLADKYVDASCQGTESFGPVAVPAGRLFVMGDNRCDSFDSRRFGSIAESSLVGQAVARIWPVSRVGGL